MSKRAELEIQMEGDKAVLRLSWRNSWGTKDRKQQITVSKRELERALRVAKVTVPWDEAR